MPNSINSKNSKSTGSVSSSKNTHTSASTSTGSVKGHNNRTGTVVTTEAMEILKLWYEAVAKAQSNGQPQTSISTKQSVPPRGSKLKALPSIDSSKQETGKQIQETNLDRYRRYFENQKSVVS